MEYVLQTFGLSKKYRHTQALRDLTLHVPKGAIYGIVGKNGAGKTTLIRLICGLQEPTSGSYALYGIGNGSADIIKARRRMGAVVETPSIYMDMSAEENLKQQYLVLGLPSFDGIPELLKLVGLETAGRKKAKHFSLGMKQRLGIALALVNSPEILLLDEPINGLDPQGIAEVRTLIHRLVTERKLTIILSSHILDELAKVANRYGIIHDGVLLDEATNEELASRCKPVLWFKTSDPEKTKMLLGTMGITQYEYVEDHFEIHERVDEGGSISMALAKEDVQTLEMRKEGQSLEEYYFQLTGGAPNV